MGIHTALIRMGTLASGSQTNELKTIDLVLLDIKAWNPDRHLRLTGMDVEPVLNFARRLAARNRAIWLRYVLVPGLTDDPQEIENIARFAASLNVVLRVDVLPFHQLGRFKWDTLGLDYKLRDTHPPSSDQVGEACAQFRKVGLTAY